MKRLSTCCALLILATGCARKPPAVAHETQLSLPGRWLAAEASMQAPDDSWWRQFGDQQLDEAVARALEHNRDLRAAAARLQAAELESRIAGADLLPALSTSFNSTRRRQNFLGFPIPGAERRVLATTFTTLGVAINVSWEADLWGRIKAGEVAALARADAQEASVGAAQLSLAGQVSKAWLALAETSQQIVLARQTVQSYERSADWIGLRYRSGLRPSLDWRLALSSLASARALLAQRLEQRERLSRQLQVLMGDYPSGTPATPQLLPELPPPIPVGLPAQILSRRPDLVATERLLLAADASIAQNRAALYPSLSLTGSGGTSSGSLLDLLDGDFGVWSLVGGLLQPVFQGGRLRNNVELSRARSEEALQTWAGAVLRALAEVETALAADQFLEQRLASREEASSQVRAALELAEGRYRRGVGDVLTVLEAQRRSLESDTLLLTLRRLRLDNRVDLHLALGGGFPRPALRLPPSDLSTASLRETQP